MPQGNEALAATTEPVCSRALMPQLREAHTTAREACTPQRIPQSDTHVRPQKVTVLSKFIEVEKVKQDEKAEELVSIKRPPEVPKHEGWMGSWMGCGWLHRTSL